MQFSFLSPKRERKHGGGHRPRAVSALTIGTLLATFLVPLTVGRAFADTPTTSADPSASESVNLALLPGTVASAKSQRMTRPEATYAPANAIDVFVHNGWTSNYASAGDGYDPTQDWFQVKLAKPAPVYEVFSLWTSPAKPTEYDLQVATDADCQTWTTVAHVVNPSDKDSQVIDREDPISCVRMQALATNSRTGYTINEFELWSGPKPAPVVGQIIPVPVRQTPGTGQPWELTGESRIVVSDDDLAATAEVLAGYLRPATGYNLPVVTGSATAADIALALASVPGLPQGNEVAAAEGYSLTVSSAGVKVAAPKAHGLFNGFQTLRQLLPAASNSPTIGTGPWTAKPITVVDYPRYAHRGLQLDPARNFLTVAETRSMIDQLAALKGDRLHLHLSDSQSWRLEIKGYPALDGRGCNGTGCLAGFYTQEDFKGLVEYAADRFIEIVPELEGPAHATAAVAALGGLAVMGCQGQTQTDRFCTDPKDPASGRALAFWKDAIAQLAAISPAPIIHIGGDEAIGMRHEDYMWWIRQMEIIVNDNGKRMMGWNPALEGYAPDSTSINHYWSDYTGGGPPLIKPEWFNHGRDVIVTPEYNAYLDFGYDGSPGRTPRTELLQSYSWDPEWVYEKYRSVWAQPAYGGPKAEDIIGIEAPIWGEQMRGLATNEYMVFPRLAGILEKAWSPKTLTQDYDAYRQRLSVAGPRWAFANVNFGTISQVTWSTEAMGTVARFGVDRTLSDAPLARMTAGSIPPGEFSAVIDWGDGSPTEPAGITGRDYLASQRQGRSLMSVSGSHSYPADQEYRGTVTYRHQDQTWAVPFIATGVPSCTKTITGTHQGPVTVSSGVTCLDDATVTGPVTVRTGAGLYASGSEVRGPLTASGALDVLLCGTTLSGPATLTSGKRVWLGNRNGNCAPATIKGPVSVTGTTGQVTIDGTTVGGPLVLRNNTAPTILAGNHIGGPLSCTGNSPAPTDAGRPNTASGPKSGQCAGL
ncbi:family 20 glycosylhydrolase [Nonomuraea sp. B12E4]|uniref:family 20 glycosylhydrolase n=1 Tax=Nonomuraea sp. B12E4 TaxID=3153564 RepID=UPI00325DDF31